MLPRPFHAAIHGTARASPWWRARARAVTARAGPPPPRRIVSRRAAAQSLLFSTDSRRGSYACFSDADAATFAAIIDDDDGRNHYPKAFSSLMAGGGIVGGQRFGKTDPEGRDVIEDAVTVQDFNATIAYAAGIPLDHVVMSASGRPFKVADKGSPVTSIFG